MHNHGSPNVVCYNHDNITLILNIIIMLRLILCHYKFHCHYFKSTIPGKIKEPYMHKILVNLVSVERLKTKYLWLYNFCVLSDVVILKWYNDAIVTVAGCIYVTLLTVLGVQWFWCGTGNWIGHDLFSYVSCDLLITSLQPTIALFMYSCGTLFQFCMK